MNDLQKTMKYSLIFGLSGAVMMPLLYEVYANVSRGFAIFLMLVWAVAAGIKLSSQKLSYAILGATACIGYAGVLGIVCYVVIHRAAVAFLNSHSEYILLSLAEQARFLLYVAIICGGIYLVCFFRKGIVKAAEIIRKNGDKSALYIKDAFNDDNGGEKWL